MSCEINVDVDEYCELFNSSHPVARTQHACIECGRHINIKEKYLYETIRDNGDLQTIKTCLDCESLRVFLCSWHYGEIRYDIKEHFFQGGTFSEDNIIKLTPAAKDFIFSVIDGEEV